MASILENAARHRVNYANIKAAIIEKGVTIPTNTPVTQYAELISSIQSGDGFTEVVRLSEVGDIPTDFTAFSMSDYEDNRAFEGAVKTHLASFVDGFAVQGNSIGYEGAYPRWAFWAADSGGGIYTGLFYTSGISIYSQWGGNYTACTVRCQPGLDGDVGIMFMSGNTLNPRGAAQLMYINVTNLETGTKDKMFIAAEGLYNWKYATYADSSYHKDMSQKLDELINVSLSSNYTMLTKVIFNNTPYCADNLYRCSRKLNQEKIYTDGTHDYAVVGLNNGCVLMRIS